MARSKSKTKKQVPQALIEQHHLDWHLFTRAVQIASASVAALLILMLILSRLL